MSTGKNWLQWWQKRRRFRMLLVLHCRRRFVHSLAARLLHSHSRGIK